MLEWLQWLTGNADQSYDDTDISRQVTQPKKENQKQQANAAPLLTAKTIWMQTFLHCVIKLKWFHLYFPWQMGTFSSRQRSWITDTCWLCLCVYCLQKPFFYFPWYPHQVLICLNMLSPEWHLCHFCPRSPLHGLPCVASHDVTMHFNTCVQHQGASRMPFYLSILLVNCNRRAQHH